MPCRNFLNPFQLVSAGDMSATITSARVDIRYLDNISVQLNFTGSPTGTFDVLGSIDGINYIALTISPALAATGSGGQLLVDLNQLSVPFIKVRYNFTSGSGSLDVWVSGKEV
jgi:hypothetical protein